MSRDERPVIGFLTDFGLDGAAAICRAVMLGICRDAQIVDISHTVRKYAIEDAAYLLRAALPFFPVGVHVAVVDPGVGTARRPIAIRVTRGDVLIGPDNGLLVAAAEALGGATEVRELMNRGLWLPATSSTFHGRDIFAPVAAHLAAGTATYADVGEPVSTESLVRLERAHARTGEDVIETAVTYVDSFGNLRLAGGAAELHAAFGPIEHGARLDVAIGSDRQPRNATYAASFGRVGRGALLLYVDSAGDLALALNQGSLAAATAATSGMPVRLTMAGGGGD